MSCVVNSQKLSDGTINENEKLKSTMYLKKGTYLKMDSIAKLSGSAKSRNDVIEKAIDFYFAYSTSQLTQDYLCGVFGAKMEGLISNLATRISKGNFRSAVEMDIITRMLAPVVQLNKSEYDKLRVKAIQETRQTNGSIDILQAVADAAEEQITE